MIQHQLEARIFRILSDFDRMLPALREEAELYSFDADGQRIAIKNGTV